jgi:hypothetical protein
MFHLQLFLFMHGLEHTAIKLGKGNKMLFYPITKLHLVVTSALFAISILCTSASAQQLSVPIVKDCVDDQAACYATSRVAGLDPNGDGFLSVRSGPGSDYQMIGKLVNGDVVTVITSRGKWYGVELRNGSLGWAHSNWLVSLAG